MTRPKLLLADDSATIRKVVQLTFSDEGIDVTTVPDADAAMLKFGEIQPDIVLVDVGMSDTSGYRICEMIKQDQVTRHIPVLLLVGSFEPFDHDEAERVMCDGFLTKPFHSIRDLVTRVWDLLGRERRAGAIAPETADIEDLYDVSMSENMRIEDLDTLDDMLGDFGMDDEMIEASQPPETANADVVDYAEPDRLSAETKEFDRISESAFADKEDAPMPVAIFEPEIIYDDAADMGQLPGDELHDSDAATVGDIDVPEPHVNSEEPSPEFISLVAERVIEKLSDRVIRQIAKEAVPKIAEKLIREALDEDKKV